MSSRHRSKSLIFYRMQSEKANKNGDVRVMCEVDDMDYFFY